MFVNQFFFKFFAGNEDLEHTNDPSIFVIH